MWIEPLTMGETHKVCLVAGVSPCLSTGSIQERDGKDREPRDTPFCVSSFWGLLVSCMVFSFIHPDQVKKILWLTTKQRMSSTSHPLWQQSKRVWAVPCAPTTKWTASIPAPTATFWMMFWNLDWLSQQFFRSCFPVSRFGIYREDLC